MTLLIVAVIVLGLLAVTRLSRVYELTASLRGKREEEISERDNRMNARLMWAFPFAYFGFFLWLVEHYRDKLLPVAASEHGVWLDDLMNFNWVILILVFFLTNILLFYFAGKYYFRKDRRAYYYPHNNKWELAWTVVPAVVMIGIIIYGLSVWNRITTPAPAGTPEVELYAQQFNWTVRYPGKDGHLGATDFRLINDNNALGIVTKEAIAQRLGELAAQIADEEKTLTEQGTYLPPDKVADMKDHIEHLRRISARVINLRTVMEEDIAKHKAAGDHSQYEYGGDDIVIKEFHLPVHEPVELLIRSKDVIHSAFLPHLRAQMNAVPGMTTRMHLTPTITTDSMRLVTNNPAFDYILLCNKICGASHFNMQMPLVVEPGADYQAWLAKQKGFQDAAAPAGNNAAPADSTAHAAATPAGTSNAQMVTAASTSGAMNQPQTH